MSSPQLENGYTKISNEILDALIKIKINSDALKIILFVIRKTYGYHKKQDKISLSQFVLATQLKKSVVCRGLNRLNNMNIIIRIANGECNIYQFNKDFDTWKPLAKLLTLAKQQTTVSQIANSPLAKQRHTKEIDTKDNITKDNSDLAVAENKININKFIKLFEPINPSYEKLYKNKTQRSALERLVKKYGEEKTAGLIKYLGVMFKDKFATKIFMPLQLEDKLAVVVAHYNNNKNLNQRKITKL